MTCSRWPLRSAPLPTVRLTVAQAPELAAGRGDEEVEPALVDQPVGLGGRLGRPDAHVRQRHRRTPAPGGYFGIGRATYPSDYPPPPSDLILPSWTMEDTEIAQAIAKTGVFGPPRTFLDCKVAERVSAAQVALSKTWR